MRNIGLIIWVLLFCIQSKGEVLLLTESFEGTNVYEANTFNDGASDYFMVLYNGIANPTGWPRNFSNIDGTNFFGGEDLTSVTNPIAEHGYIVLNSQNVSAYDSVRVKVLLAAVSSTNADASHEQADGDGFDIQYAFDGNIATAGAGNVNTGTYTTIAQFRGNDGINSTNLFEDTNLDGTGDGTSLTETFQEFTYTYAVNGGTNTSVRIKAIAVQGSEELAVDNIRIYGISSNTDPTIAIDNSNLSYTEDAAATQIDAAATTSDADGDADWNSGTLQVQITGNAEAADEISISDTDGDGTAITVSGTNILSNGTDIGDLSASSGVVTNNTMLTITFDSDATNANVQEVLQSIRYRNTSNDPGTSNRTVTFTVTDANSGTANDTRTIALTALNDEPTLTATGSNPTFTEGGSTAGLFSSASASTIESGQTFAGMTFTVTNVNDGSSERINMDGSQILLTHGTSGTTATNSLGYSVSVAATTATVTLTGGTMSAASLQTLINGMNYQNNSNTPNTSNRVVTITGLTDSGSNIGGNDNVAALAIASTVSVESVGEVTSVSVPADASYGTGQNLDFTVNFDENITVNTGGGTPRISLTIGAATRYATYQIGSGTSALLFSYTVQAGDVDNDGIAVAGSITLNGSVLTNADANSAELTLNSVGSTVSVLVDAVTQTPTLTTPATSSTDNSALDIDFTLPEAASSGTVKMTFTRTGGTADANAPHVLTFAAGFETAAQHTTTLNGADLSNNANVSSVSSGVNDMLVDGAIYSVKLEYEDALGNSAASVTNTNVTYDNTTQTPTLATPANSSTDNSSLDIDFTLPEAASSGTVKMTFTRTGGSADANAPHVLTFAAGFETAAQHTTTLNGTDLSNNANVSSVSSGVNDMLVNGAIYSVKLEYQDGVGNTAASVTNTTVTYDNATLTPTLTTPASSSSDNGSLAIDFTLPEAASSGTVKMTFTRTGGSADANAPHVLTFAAGFETAAQHTTTLDGADLSNNANVSSVSTDGSDALVDGAIYSVKLEYQDALGNSAASVTNTAFTYDNATATPTLTTPASSSSDNSTLAIDFTLPEAASSGTVKMTFTRTGGSADANAPHVLTFAAGFETATQHTTTLDGTDLSNNANVTSVTTDGSDMLVDGAVYSVKLEYQDALGNTAASVTNTNVTYDNTTQTPTLTTPATSATDNNAFDIDFTLPEAASSGTVKMTFTRTGGTADANAPHVLTFAAGFETAAQHTTTLDGTDLSNNANVSSVSSGVNDMLVNGAIYSVKLEYQDGVGNSAASVTNTTVTYDNGTLTPTLSTPASSSSDNAALDIDFTLPESASSGTVKMTFTRTGGSADANAPHVLTFAAGFETAAQHTTTLDGTDLSNNANVSSVSSGVNDMLVSGTIYSVKLEYQDALGNSASSVTNTNVTYDNATQTPTLTTPANSSTDNSSLDIDFTLPEAASSGTVKMTFTRTGGTADANAPHVLTFAAGFETATQHTATLDGNDLSSNANVASVSSDGNDMLVHNAIYSVKLEYQDGLVNASASVTNTSFTYDNPNSAPALSIDNSTLAYTENDGATQIDAASTVSDPDGDADWDGGNITLQITGNYESDDELNILNNVVGSINVLYPNIRDGSTVFGTLSFVPAAGGMGIKFTATLNSEATNARVQQLIRAVYYKSNSENPGTSDRTVTVTATDKNSNMASDTRTISVTRTNDAPTLSSVTSQAMPEDSLLTILPSMTNGADVDGDVLAVVLGAGANFTVVGDTVKPNANISGVLQVPVAITDGTDTTAGLYMSITVTAVNDTPTVDMPMPDTTLTEDFNPINYRDLNSVFSDIEDGSALAFTAMTLQNKLDLIIKSSDSVLVLVAKTDVYGIDTVVVTASDGTLSVKDSIIVTITSAEDAPSIITPIPDTTVVEDFATPINYRDLNDIFTDSDGDAITFSVESKAGKITPSINGADSMLVLTAVADAYGVDTLIVTAKDASDSTNDTVFVTISPVNDAPTMTAVSNQATVEDSLLTIVINMTNAADADDDILSIVLGSGSNYTVAGDTVKVVENFTGNLSVPVSVTDGIETTAPVNMNILVTPKNDAPIVLNSLPDTTVLEDFVQFAYRDLNMVFSDEESGTNLTYTVVSLTGKTLPSLQVSDSSLLLAPVTNANGSDIVVVTAMDEALSVSDTMIVTISPVNDAPSITSATAQTVAEEAMLTILLSMTDATDIDNVLTDAGVVVDAGTNYTVDGSTITPVKDFTGELTVPIRITDGTDTSVAVNMSVTVTEVNDAPIMSTATTQTIAEDGALTILLSMTDASDIDNTLTDASLIVEAGNVYTVDGRTVTPFANYNGTMTVPIKVTDGEYTSSTVNMLVTVTPVNDAPTMSTVAAQTIAEDQPLKVLLSMTDAADIDDLLSNNSIVIEAGENYTVEGTTLTPAANFSGNLTVPVKVTDGELTSATVNMSVTVTPVNDTPTITTATTQTIVEEGSLTILLSMTDAADVDNTLTEESLIVEAGENYTLVGKTITPAVNFNGMLSVPLKVTDGTSTSAPITMSVEVTPVNDAPTLTAVTAQTTAEDVPFAITLAMTDAADVDNTLTDASLIIEAGSNYTVSGTTITPALNFSGALTVPVKATDGVETTAAVNMALTVTPVNDAPTVTSATAQTIIENTSLTVTLDMVEGEADVDNSVLSIVVGTGENYTVSGTTLTPTAGYVGTLSVPIYVSDGELNSLPVTMTVTVLKENSAPVLEAVAPFVMQQDVARMLTIADVTASDEDGDALTLLIGAGANYTVTGTTITPAPGFVGTLSVPFSVTDGDKSSNVITVSVTVKAANTNTTPVVAGASLNLEKDRSLTLTPTLVNATDADGDGLTLIVTTGTNYTVTGTTVTPVTDYVGILSVAVQATDGIDTSVIATIPISVYEKKIGFHIGQVLVSDTFTVTVVPNPVPPGENLLYITAPQEEFDELRVKIYSHTSDLMVEGDADVEWGTFIFTWDLSRGRTVPNGYSYVALLSFVKDGVVVKQDTKILGVAR